MERGATKRVQKPKWIDVVNFSKLKVCIIYPKNPHMLGNGIKQQMFVVYLNIPNVNVRIHTDGWYRNKKKYFYFIFISHIS